ncbi:hypothetical protein A2U01_0078324, partial [Trifolium medium]|nr:hypothetical protein [Trifolium medium]
NKLFWSSKKQFGAENGLGAVWGASRPGLALRRFSLCQLRLAPGRLRLAQTLFTG